MQTMPFTKWLIDIDLKLVLVPIKGSMVHDLHGIGTKLSTRQLQNERGARYMEFVKLLSIQYPPLKGQPIRKCDPEMLMPSQKTAAHFFSTSRTKHSSVR